MGPEPGGNLGLAVPGSGSRHPSRDDGVAVRGRRGWLCRGDRVGCTGMTGQPLPGRRLQRVIPAGCRNPGPWRVTSMLVPGCEWWGPNRVATWGLPSLALGPGIRAGTTGGCTGTTGWLCRGDGCSASFRRDAGTSRSHAPAWECRAGAPRPVRSDCVGGWGGSGPAWSAGVWVLVGAHAGRSAGHTTRQSGTSSACRATTLECGSGMGYGARGFHLLPRWSVGTAGAPRLTQ